MCQTSAVQIAAIQKAILTIVGPQAPRLDDDAEPAKVPPLFQVFVTLFLAALAALVVNRL